MSTTQQQGYDASAIAVLEGLEPVRKRPGMYIGGTGKEGLHHLVWEIVDNAVDEAINGYATTIHVTLEGDGRTVTVSDNGRGIPIDIHPKVGRPALEVILTTAASKKEHIPPADGLGDSTNWFEVTNDSEGWGSSIKDLIKLGSSRFGFEVI